MNKQQIFLELLQEARRGVRGGRGNPRPSTLSRVGSAIRGAGSATASAAGTVGRASGIGPIFKYTSGVLAGTSAIVILIKIWSWLLSAKTISHEYATKMLDLFTKRLESTDDIRQKTDLELVTNRLKEYRELLVKNNVKEAEEKKESLSNLIKSVLDNTDPTWREHLASYGVPAAIIAGMIGAGFASKKYLGQFWDNKQKEIPMKGIDPVLKSKGFNYFNK